MRFSEQYAHPYIIKPADCAAGVDGDSVHMGRVHTIAYTFAFGAATGSAPVLTFYVGATEGTKTTAIAFNYRITAAAQGAATADLFGALTAVASTGLTLTTMTSKLLIVEFDAAGIPEATPWLTPRLEAGATTFFMSCTAIGNPRNAGNVPPTVIK